MKFKIAGLLLCLNFTFSACAQIGLSNSNPDDVLAPYPAIGSIEEKEDIAQLLYFQNTRTKEQCEVAAREASSSLENFFGGLKGPLSKDEVSKVQKNIKWLTVKTGSQILYNKRKFNRPRPYVTHPEVKPCIELESSKSYPSGHTVLSRVYARILAVIYPERSIQFLKRADEIAMNRIIGGVHHPSDIVAGKILGDVLADDYLSDNEFYNELVSLGH